MDVSAWLRGLGLERYAQAFEANDVDAQALRWLTQADLVEIGVASVGHRRKLIAAIAALSREQMLEPSGTPGSASLSAERRQLSVLYCEMISAAELPLQPEDMREVMRSFHDACTAAVAEYDGHTANFYGDCLLAYFGWPRAHEDDVERAVRAGLALMRQIPQLSAAGPALSARAGIATGEVVVGDLIHQGPAQEQSAVGLVPNLGARLLGLAAPGQVVLDELTRRLLPPNFALQPLGRHAFKGLSEPVAAYAVVEEQLSDSRFDARKGPELTPMIGRDQELDLLLERWRQAHSGEGQAVLLVGEAGIGKSRLTRALLDAGAGQHWMVRWQCSPYHTGSALWPVIQRLSRAAGLDAQDSTEQALDKLETFSGAAAAALYATLLGLNGSQRYGPLEMTPQMLRERTLELLVEQLREMAGHKALLVVVEDAHWIDPSTLELLERCLDSIDCTPMLILITSRPDNQPQLGAHPSVTRLSLNRLSRASVQSMVKRLGGRSLNPQTQEAIVAQTDGVPLFVEELTKAVLETGEAAVPASLHGSLMARLDRVPEVREVAQIAACIGREFDPALVRAVAEQPETVSAALDKLAAAELIFHRGDEANPRFVFKHALVQEAAYQSLLKAARQRLHGRICYALRAAGGAPPEVLAHHALGADRVAQAIEWWQEAGDAALGKSAYLEAAGHFGRAVELVGTRPDRKERRQQELAILTRLGQANAAGHGTAATETKRAFDRAYQLLHPEQDAAFRVPVLYGVWIGLSMRPDCAQALEIATVLHAAVQEDGDDAQRMLAHRLLGASHLLLGDLVAARSHLERSVALVESARGNSLTIANQVGMDPGAIAYCWLAWALALRGFAEQATAMLQRVRTLELVASPNLSRTYLHQLCAQVWMCLADSGGVASDTSALAVMADKHHLPMPQGFASCYLGWLALQHQRPDEAIEKYDEGLARLAASGVTNRVLFLAGRAVALAACDRVDEAERVIEQAILGADRTGQRWCAAELLRVRGDVALKRSVPDLACADESFVGAIELARQQQAKLWEIRAAVSLARLRMTQGRDTEALRVLVPVYESFTEGFDTADLVEARDVLAVLEQPRMR